jgi:glucose/arabinose dehydrogenase
MQLSPETTRSLDPNQLNQSLGQPATELVFIDTSLESYRRLAASATIGAEVILLDGQRDGISQITEALADRQNIEAIHLISHGSAGALQLGSSHFSDLGQYQTQLQSWQQSLSADADILIYGCDVAATAAGQDFIQQISQLTGADVAASTNLTGNAAKGGDWILETTTGTIDHDLALSQSLQSSYDGIFAGFTYNNFSNSTGITTNGNASKPGTTLQLTPDSNTQAGSAFYDTAFQLDANSSFSTQFQFRLGGVNGTTGADGFTFVLQNDSRGTSAIGASGGGVGYQGINNSLAIEFDTYKNGNNDPNDNHLSLLRNGNVFTAVKDVITPLDLNSGAPINAWIDYDGATDQLNVYLSTTTTKPTTATLTQTIDLVGTLGTKAYFGFTGGTGGLRNLQEIQNWTLNTTATPIVPTGGGTNGTGTGLRGEYFDNIDFTNSKVVRTDGVVDFNWANGSPDLAIANDTFSVRWTGQIQPKFGEEYTFYTTSDDGVRLKINGQTVVDRFVNQASTTATGKITLAANQKYDIVMEYFENTGRANAQLEWSSTSQARQVVAATQLYSAPPPPGPTGGNGTGLIGTYYDNINFTNPVLTRTDTSVDFNWGNGSPAPTIANDTFSVVWTGQVQALFSETYTFFTNTDDGVRLFVNGQQVINQFTDQAPTTVNGTPIALMAGQKYDIRMEYFENAGGAVAQLGWQSSSQARQIIPKSQLFSGGAGVFEIDVTGVSVSEGAGTATVIVNRVNGSSGAATVDYVTNENTALRDVDFSYRAGTLNFADGETSKTVVIPILEDAIVEGTESFGVAILGATGAALGTKRTVSVNILDNDAAASEFSFSQSAYEIKEDGGQATITVRRTGNTTGIATINYATSDGTANAGSDYTAATGTITFAANETSKTFTVGITNDTLGERNESINLQLSNAAGPLPGAPGKAVLNILDNDPGSFIRETTITGLTTPTAMEWTPNGQYMFIAEQNGLVKVATTSNNQLQATPFIDLRDQVNGVRDRGLLGMTLDPKFATGRPYVYLLFTYDPPQAGDTTRPGYSNDFGGKDQQGNRPARLIRVEAELVNGVYRSKAGSEVILLGKNSNFANTSGFDANSTLVTNVNIPPSGYVRDANGNNTSESIQDYITGDSESHSVGYVQFGADGKLYVSTGDGASYNGADPRAVRVQDIDNLSGKILRIDPDTGAGLADNPFYNATTGTALDAKYNNNVASNRSKVYNLGLRNPFRFTFDPKTNQPVVGDVGWFTWEEINTGRGKNFGWPAYEGGLDANGAPINVRTPSYENLPNVTPFYPGGPKAITPDQPLFAFQHQSSGGDAIILGEYYTASAFPSFYDNALFYSNASKGTVNTVFFDQTGKVSGTQLFADNFQGITQLNVGPDGSLYYVNLGIPIGGGTGTGSIGRWRPTTGTTAPNAPVFSPGTNPIKTIPGAFQAR